jgi:hypothetical protein
MGRLGAGIAYWTYLSMGFGVWLPMIASAVALAATASGREVSHPAIRTFGAVVMMLALSSLHATWFGNWGVLAGAEAGLVPQWISNQLLMHFSPTLASLVLMISLSLGAIICMDEVVFALPRHIMRAWNATQPVRAYDWKGLIAKMRVRPQLFQPKPALAGVPAARPAKGNAAVAVLEQDELEEVAEAEEELEAIVEDEVEEEPAPVKNRRKAAVKEVVEETDELEEEDEIEAEEEEEVEEAQEVSKTASAPEPEPVVQAKAQLSEEELKAKIAKLPLDINPTLVELCGLPPRDGLEGTSLVPQIQDATAPRERPAVTTHNRGNHAVRSEHWRYIRYADSSEELYDLRSDPHEWTNLAGRPEHAAVIADKGFSS